MFSDESSVQSQSNNRRGWVFRKPHEKFLKNLVNITLHGKSKISIMVWAAVWRDGRSELIIMERDSNSRRQGYTARSYQKALEEGLLPVYDGIHRFQQDNARIHTSASSIEWLQVHAIEYIDWPAHSPDLNPIEHVWKALKERIISLFPHLRELNNNEVSRAELKRCMKEAWAAIPQSLIQRLIESLPRRLEAVIRARGYYTKY